MPIPGVLFYLACLLHPVNGQLTDDFSNNLATDLGPLLSLFGDSMTKQYLSESVTFLDYLVFALAPIGIITTIVSVIRVCGSPWLRAFIGRAQEGPGPIEAELCTSTSRDVCELFNRSGITRVLGRPKLLEIIRVPLRSSAADEPKKQEVEEQTRGLHLFQHYLREFTGNDPTADEWLRKGPSDGEFPPNPNITLNVGIKRLPQPLVLGVAVIGILLQATLLVLAGLGAHHFPQLLGNDPTADDETLHKETESRVISRDGAVRSFIIGTLSLSIGMFTCACLIGQRTSEQTFLRTKDKSRQLSQLLWLQPGSQVIGDQTFDSFSYIEDPNNKLTQYTSSCQRKDSQHSAHITSVAVVVTLGGYIAQFVGLRGLGPWIAIGQIAGTLIMSLMRGLLKTRDLTKEHNRITGDPDLIVGHELDWLALTLSRCAKTMTSKAGGPDVYWFVSGAKASIERPVSSASTHIDDTLEYRRRLANLTGHFGPNDLCEGEYQMWRDQLVNVRAKSVRLARALCQSIDTLVQEARPVEFGVSLHGLFSQGNNRTGTNFSITFMPVEQSSGRWRVDSSRLEAILGLWLWSIKKGRQTDRPKPSSGSNEKPTNFTTRQARIVFAEQASGSRPSEVATNTRYEMWLGQKAVQPSYSKMILHPGSVCGSSDLWAFDESLQSWTLPNSTTGSHTAQRFYGWSNLTVKQPLSNFFASNARVSPNAQPSIRVNGGSNIELNGNKSAETLAITPDPIALDISYVQLAEPSRATSISHVLDGLAQELYSSIISAIAPKCELGQITPYATYGQVGLRNETISALVKTFSDPENDLGSDVEAFYCILPAFDIQLEDRVESGPSLLSMLKKEATNHRKNNKWRRAESLLQWAVKICVPDLETSEDALISLAELYRLAIASPKHERRVFGYGGVKWLYNYMEQVLPAPTSSEESYIKSNREACVTIVLRYVLLAGHFAEKRGETKEFPIGKLYQALASSSKLNFMSFGRHIALIKSKRELSTSPGLLKAAASGLRIATLKHLTELNTSQAGLEESFSALPLCAALHWNEIAEALLELGAPVDSRWDDRPVSGRIPNIHMTALMTSSSLGNMEMVELLLSRGAEAQFQDSQGNNALFYAVQAGHELIVKRLLDTGSVDPNGSAESQLSPIAVAAQRNHHKVVQVLNADTRIDLNSCIIVALQNGHEELLRYLLTVPEMTVSSHLAAEILISVVITGHENAVKKLLDDVEKRFDVNASLNGDVGEFFKYSLSMRMHREIEHRIPGRTALSWAAQSGHASIVSELLSRSHIKASITDSQKRNPLWYAADAGYAGIAARFLALDNQKLNIPDDNGVTPLLQACRRGHADVVKILLPEHPVANSRYLIVEKGKELTVTPLTMAARDGNDQVVEILLESQRFDPDETAQDGRTALLEAAFEGSACVVEQLLTLGRADPNISDNRGDTALFDAMMQRHVDIVNILVNDTRCNVNAVSDSDPRFTALREAIEWNNLDFVKALLSRSDCDVNQRSGELNELPLVIAVTRDNYPIVEALIRRGEGDVALDSESLSSALDEAVKLERGIPMRTLLEDSLMKLQKPVVEESAVA